MGSPQDIYSFNSCVFRSDSWDGIARNVEKSQVVLRMGLGVFIHLMEKIYIFTWIDMRSSR